MDGIFSLPYSEYATILEVQKHVKKSAGLSVFIPVSRQQKGVDFVIVNTTNRKTLTVQVKASRSWNATEFPKRPRNEVFFAHGLWFNNFVHGYVKGQADIYMLFGNYPIYDAGKGIKSRTEIWRPVVLAFKDSEMKELLDQVKTKREQKADQFFYIRWNEPHHVFGTRGFPSPKDLSHHLLVNKAQELLADLR